MFSFLSLFGGLIVIIISANWLVDGASTLAKKLGISDIVIGLTIVAFGTSAPELTVNIFSAAGGNTDIAIGNIIGSNIANILLILGISAIIYPIKILDNTKWKEIPFSLLAIIVLAIVANDFWLDGSSNGSMISRSDGLILLCFMAIFLFYTFEIAKRKSTILFKNPKPEEIKSRVKKSLYKEVILIVTGLTGLFFGGKYLVEGAVSISRILGMSEKVIGLTIIAIGTSVPELATSVVATIKKNSEIAVGNIVGSNIFNVFFILGITALIRPIPFNLPINFDLMIAAISSILLFLSTITFRKKTIDRTEGILFLTLYIWYITYSIMI